MSNEDMSNDELLASLLATLRAEASLLAKVVALLIEVEERRLHLELACSSMHDFCTRRLGLSEGEAWRRITAARLARRFPQLLEAMSARQIHLSTVVLLRDVLTASNVDALITATSGRTKCEVEELVARLAPKPDVPEAIRKLPEPRAPDPRTTAAAMASTLAEPDARPGERREEGRERTERTETREGDGPFAAGPVALPGGVGGTPPRPPQVVPLAEGRYRIQLTASAALRDKLERARSLMRHRNVDGDLATVIDRALDLLIAKLEKEKLGSTDRPRAGPGSGRASDRAGDGDRSSGPAPTPSRATGAMSSPPAVAPAVSSSAGAPPGSRRIPAAVRREVVRRDGERCSFVSATGERCPARDLLELDHRHPHALGGKNTSSNTRLLCRAHNRLAAEEVFGRDHVARAIARRRRSRSKAPPRSHDDAPAPPPRPPRESTPSST